MLVDYDHATDLAASEGARNPAAGWIVDFRVRAGFIEARINYTQSGAEALADKQWRFVSPVFDDETGEVVRIRRVALTNNPALKLRAICSTKGSAMTRRLTSAEMAVCSALNLEPAAFLRRQANATAARRDERNSGRNVRMSKTVLALCDAFHLKPAAFLAAHSQILTAGALGTMDTLARILDINLADASTEIKSRLAELAPDVQSIAHGLGVGVEDVIAVLKELIIDGNNWLN